MVALQPLRNVFGGSHIQSSFSSNLFYVSHPISQMRFPDETAVHLQRDRKKGGCVPRSLRASTQPMLGEGLFFKFRLIARARQILPGLEQPGRTYAAMTGRLGKLNSTFSSGSRLSTPASPIRTAEAHAGHCSEQLPMQLQSWQR